MNMRILQPGKNYTFSKYFELPYTTGDILAEFNCKFIRENLDLPKFSDKISFREVLNHYLRRNLRYVNPISEVARREALIAPILFEVCAETQTELNIEYTVNVSEQLKGTFDYYINSNIGMLVIEAKQADLGRGFTQLAVELIALDQWTKSKNPLLYGAVTTGENWRFGIFNRQEKIIYQDLKLYQIPEELEQLLRVLIGIIVTPSTAE
jgi:hypothetical protein